MNSILHHRLSSTPPRSSIILYDYKLKVNSRVLNKWLDVYNLLQFWRTLTNCATDNPVFTLRQICLAQNKNMTNIQHWIEAEKNITGKRVSICYSYVWSINWFPNVFCRQTYQIDIKFGTQEAKEIILDYQTRNRKISSVQLPPYLWFFHLHLIQIRRWTFIKIL